MRISVVVFRDYVYPHCLFHEKFYFLGHSFSDWPRGPRIATSVTSFLSCVYTSYILHAWPSKKNGGCSDAYPVSIGA